MNAKEPAIEQAQTGVDDVRRVREQIAQEHNGDLAAHVVETNRIAEKLRKQLGLGPVVPPPSGGSQRSGAEGRDALPRGKEMRWLRIYGLESIGQMPLQLH